MLDRVPRRWLLIGYGVVLALITLALSWIAYRAMFTSFDVPDDDGYLLMSLKKFNAGGSLYGEVYSQYGPGVFVLIGGVLRAIGVALTSDGARDVNLVLWLVSTLLAGLSLLRLTGKFLVSAAGLLVAFLVLKVDANEPLHPGATIAFLLIAMVAVAVFFLPSRPRAALAAVGAIGAALLSIKVNVGLFALLSVGVACVATVPALRRHLSLRLLAFALFVAIPFAVLSEHLSEGTTLRFAALVSIGALGIVLIATRLPPARVPDGRGVVALVVGALAVVVLVSIVPMLGGTSPGELIDGWIIRPADTPGIQHVPFLVHPWVWVWGALGLGAAIAVHGAWGEPLSPLGHIAAGIGRTLSGLLIWVALVGPIFELPLELTQPIVVGAPLLWIAMLDPKGQSPKTSFLRVLVPALAVLQFLHTYPVSGSQLHWGGFLLVVVGGICVADGAEELAAAGLSQWPRFAAWPAIASIPVIVFGAWLCLKPLRTEARQVKGAYEAGVELDLPGAREMRMPEPLALQLQGLTRGLRTHCDTFLTIPGMNSLNLFSGEEPPVELSGPWPFFFTAEEQRKIVDAVKGIPRFCIVDKPDLLAFWAGYSGNVVPQRPLVSYIENEFTTLHNYSGYYLLVSKRGD